MSRREAPPDPPSAGAPAPFVHPSAVVDPGAELAAGVKVWHFCHVSAGARVGADSVLGQGVYVGPGVRIGKRCKIQNHVSVYEGVTLEDEVFVGPSAVFTNVSTPRAHVSRRGSFLTTVVGTRATVGANATIVCGANLGPRSFVAAGSTVTKNVPAGALVRGIPARVVGAVCGCGEVLRGDGPSLACDRCGARWRRSTDGGAAEAP